MDVVAVQIAVGAAIVAGTWRLASVLAGVRVELIALSRRVRRIEAEMGIEDDAPPEGQHPLPVGDLA